MRTFLGSIRRSIRRIGFFSCVLGIAAVVLFLGSVYSPLTSAPVEVTQYNQAIDAMHTSSPEVALDTLQSLWHDAQNPAVREASAYNVGTLIAESPSVQDQIFALQALAGAVRMNPYDENAKRNLEILLRRVAKKVPSEKSGEGSSNAGNQPQGSGNVPPSQPENSKGGYNQPASGF